MPMMSKTALSRKAVQYLEENYPTAATTRSRRMENTHSNMRLLARIVDREDLERDLHAEFWGLYVEFRDSMPHAAKGVPHGVWWLWRASLQQPWSARGALYHGGALHEACVQGAWEGLQAAIRGEEYFCLVYADTSITAALRAAPAEGRAQALGKPAQDALQALHECDPDANIAAKAAAIAKVMVPFVPVE